MPKSNHTGVFWKITGGCHAGLLFALTLVVIASLLAGCHQTAPPLKAAQPSTSPAASTLASATVPSSEAAIREPTHTEGVIDADEAAPTKTPRFKVLKSVSEASSGGTAKVNPYPLSEPGPYRVGMRTITATDSNRPQRKISITLWYPALVQAEDTSHYGHIDAAPDPSGAPYPLLLSSTKIARTFAPTLVSHGFTWASIDDIDTYDHTNPEMLHQPLDILFALQHLTSSQPEGLQGMFDSEHAGAIGYSFDGYNALVLSGARIDPQHYLGLCKDPLETKKTVGYWFEGSYNCWLAQKWDSFATEAGEELTKSQDGLWQPVTDPRIRAVMPLAADGYYLFGDKGLAAVKVPVMFIVGTNDDMYPENALIYDHLGSAEKTFLSILNRDHIAVIYDPEIRLRLNHFAVAFFGYQLRGEPEYAQYFSEESVNQLDGMAWGVIEENPP